MPNKNWLKSFQLKIYSPETLFALMILALTKLPVGIRNAAELFYIGQNSNQIWESEKSHEEANLLAVQKCNGRK